MILEGVNTNLFRHVTTIEIVEELERRGYRAEGFQLSIFDADRPAAELESFDLQAFGNGELMAELERRNYWFVLVPNQMTLDL